MWLVLHRRNKGNNEREQYLEVNEMRMCVLRRMGMWGEQWHHWQMKLHYREKADAELTVWGGRNDTYWERCQMSRNQDISSEEDQAGNSHVNNVERVGLWVREVTDEAKWNGQIHSYSGDLRRMLGVTEWGTTDYTFAICMHRIYGLSFQKRKNISEDENP